MIVALSIYSVLLSSTSDENSTEDYQGFRSTRGSRHSVRFTDLLRAIRGTHTLRLMIGFRPHSQLISWETVNTLTSGSTRPKRWSMVASQRDGIA
ncbi:hypothetical protein FHX35_000296 [Auritidibacter ignavus]|nr:hypothetical protein [Auritidibacter ignavus]